MQGTRSFSDQLQSGHYGMQFGEWFGITPNGLLVKFPAESVTEHQDWTISVSGTIVAQAVGKSYDADPQSGSYGQWLDKTETWTGTLTAGVWAQSQL